MNLAGGRLLQLFDGVSQLAASATFRFLPMFMLQTQNMNISNNSNILQLECIKSRLWTILLRLPFNLGYFVAFDLGHFLIVQSEQVQPDKGGIMTRSLHGIIVV